MKTLKKLCAAFSMIRQSIPLLQTTVMLVLNHILCMCTCVVLLVPSELICGIVYATDIH